MLCKLTIIGNLGSQPEMRYTPDGTPVVNFSVATNRKWNNADGSQGEETTWFRCTAWRRTAEVVNEYLSKGRQVYIEGRLNPDENGSPKVFQRQDGTSGASYEVTVETIKFLGGSNGSAPQQQAAPVEFPEDQIPF